MTNNSILTTQWSTVCKRISCSCCSYIFLYCWKSATTRQFINVEFVIFSLPQNFCVEKRLTGFFVICSPIRIWPTVYFLFIYYLFYYYFFFLIRYTLNIIYHYTPPRSRISGGRMEGSANDKWQTEQMRLWRLAKKKTKLPVRYKTTR